MFLPKVRPMSVVPFKYLTICLAAFMCSFPGLLKNLEHCDTAKAISGRVPTMAYTSFPTSALYSLRFVLLSSSIS